MNVGFEFVFPDGKPKPICTNCSQPADHVIVLAIGRLEPFKLCDPCVDVLRSMIPPRNRRGRRALSPKARRVLAWMAQTPAEYVSLDAIGAATGGYATNVVKGLCERGMLQAGVVRGFYGITARGLEQVRP